MNHPFPPDLLITRESVPLFNVELLTRSLLKSVQPFLCYSLIRKVLFRWQSYFFFYFIYFICTLYEGLREPRSILFSDFHTVHHTLLFNNSLILSLVSIKLAPAFLSYVYSRLCCRQIATTIMMNICMHACI